MRAAICQPGSLPARASKSATESASETGNRSSCVWSVAPARSSRPASVSTSAAIASECGVVNVGLVVRQGVDAHDERPIGALEAARQAQGKPDALHTEHCAQLGALQRQLARAVGAEGDVALGEQAASQRPPLDVRAR